MLLGGCFLLSLLAVLVITLLCCTWEHFDNIDGSCIDYGIQSGQGCNNERYQTAASRGAPASLKSLIIPAVINDTGHVGPLANTLRETGGVTLGPSSRVVCKGKLAKPRSYTAGSEETDVE